MNNFLVRHTGFGVGSIKALLCPFLFPYRAYKREPNSIHPFTGHCGILSNAVFGLDEETWQEAGGGTNRTSLFPMLTAQRPAVTGDACEFPALLTICLCHQIALESITHKVAKEGFV